MARNPIEPSAGDAPLIDICQVGKVYPSDRGPIEAIRSVSCSIRQGEFVSILGPSGCGKSTLLSMIAGLDTPSTGSLTVAGRPIDAPLRQVGVVFQDPVLLPWKSVLENVLFPIRIMKENVDAYRQRAIELLESVGLKDFHAQRPHELSGGMRQRVSICRAMIHDPDVLLMDEPFSALDTITRDQMNASLMNLWERYRKTAVFVTHSIREAVYLSDRVLVMGNRPSTVIWEQPISFPRPRKLSIDESPEFNEVYGLLRRKIDQAYDNQPAAQTGHPVISNSYAIPQ